MKKILEKIFWKDGKFLDKKGNKIKPEAVGTPVIITQNQIQINKDKIIGEYLYFINKNKINAYTEGDAQNYREKLRNEIIYFTSFQFYKKKK